MTNILQQVADTAVLYFKIYERRYAIMEALRWHGLAVTHHNMSQLGKVLAARKKAKTKDPR